MVYRPEATQFAWAKRKTIMKKIAILTALIASSFALNNAFAQSNPVVSPQGIIVNPVQTTLQAQVSVDKQGINPVYFVGENIKIRVSVNQDAYVYLFSIDAAGSVDLILPNRFAGGAEFMRGGETKQFPPQGANWQLNITAPYGQDQLLVVASKRQLNLSEIATFKNGQSFATVNPSIQGSSGLARPLAVVVSPLPAQDWVTTTAQFQVQARGYVSTPPAPVVVQPNPAPTVVVQPNPSVSVNININTNRPNPVVISSDPFTRFGMNLMPGSSIIRIFDNDNDSFSALITTNNSIGVLADTHRRQLETRGWAVSKIKIKNENIRLEFRRGDEGMKLRLERDGNAVRFSVEID